jgi:hypothetical protein
VMHRCTRSLWRMAPHITCVLFEGAALVGGRAPRHYTLQQSST